MINEQEVKQQSVLPLLVGDDNELTEVTLCTSISGGRNEINGMPAELTLLRETIEGTIIRARYILSFIIE